VKVRIYRNISPSKLRGLIPKKYRQQICWTDFQAGESVLLLFRNDREDVVLSSTVRRTLNSVSDLTEPFRLAIGGGFTIEAANLLSSSGFRIFALSDFFWTDQSYKSITNAIA